MSEITLREIEEKDAEQVFQLQHQLFTSGYAWDLKYIKKLASRGAGVVGLDGNKVIGFVLTEKGVSETKRHTMVNIVSSVGVSSEYQGRGLSKLLVQRIVDSIPNENWYLTVKSGNVPAIKSYSKVGFKIIHLLSRYYDDTNPPSDGFYMELKRQ